MVTGIGYASFQITKPNTLFLRYTGEADVRATRSHVQRPSTRYDTTHRAIGGRAEFECRRGAGAQRVVGRRAARFRCVAAPGARIQILLVEIHCSNAAYSFQ